jgi:hypothetical protein
MIAKIKVFILWFFTPLQKIMQRLGRDETVIDAKIVARLMSEIKPGDILLSHERQRLTSIFIRGFYDHAAIVSHRGTVIEAVGDKFIRQDDGTMKNIGGVREVDLEEWLYKKDFVAVIRAKIHPFIVARASENSISYLGCNYDYVFSHNNFKIYCSELVYLCYVKEWSHFLKELPDDTEILPQAYLELCDEVSYLELVAETRDASLRGYSNTPIQAQAKR